MRPRLASLVSPVPAASVGGDAGDVLQPRPGVTAVVGAEQAGADSAVHPRAVVAVVVPQRGVDAGGIGRVDGKVDSAGRVVRCRQDELPVLAGAGEPVDAALAGRTGQVAGRGRRTPAAGRPGRRRSCRSSRCRPVPTAANALRRRSTCRRRCRRTSSRRRTGSLRPCRPTACRPIPSPVRPASASDRSATPTRMSRRRRCSSIRRRRMRRRTACRRGSGRRPDRPRARRRWTGRPGSTSRHRWAAPSACAIAWRTCAGLTSCPEVNFCVRYSAGAAGPPSSSSSFSPVPAPLSRS